MTDHEWTHGGEPFRTQWNPWKTLKEVAMNVF